MTGERLNCWEYQKCGRGPAGKRTCPTGLVNALDGTHDGVGGGRACWVVSDTLCEGEPSGPYERKMAMCSKCAFYLRVAVEQGLDYVAAEELHESYCSDS